MVVGEVEMVAGTDLKEDLVPQNAHLLLFVIASLGEVFTELKLQKLLFQIQNEAKIPGGYPYFKHLYGPYSRELHVDTLTLANQGLITHDVVVGNHGPYSKYSITEQGKAYFKEYVLPNLKEKDLTRMRQVLDTYSGYKPLALAELVYKQWRIEDTDALNNASRETLGSLKTVKSFWESLYFPECVVITYYLAFAEYALDAVDRVESRDAVNRSVLVNACRELSEKLETIAEACSKRGECPADVVTDICNSTAPSVYEIFEFVEDFCDRNNILQKLVERKVEELMTEEEYRRLTKSFQTPLA